MTPWSWWAGSPGEATFDIAEADSRDEVIRLACRELGPGDVFEIVEARSSSARKYEGEDHVPFLRTRNRETVKVGPSTTPDI